MARRPTRPGRPPLGRIRYPYRPFVEEIVLDRLSAQSAVVGVPPASYLERVVCLAHGFESPFLRPLLQSLPTEVEASTLQQFAKAISPDDCTPVVADVPTRPTTFRIDAALGEQINAWCEEYDVEYASYMRSILRMAAGFDSDEQLRPHHFQDQLLGYRTDRGRVVAS